MTMQNSNELELELDVEVVEVIEKTWGGKNELCELILAFRNKTITSDAFYRAAYPLVAGYCKYARNHSKLTYFTTDILENVIQNVMIIFYKGVAEKVDLDQNFLGYLYKIINREVYQFNRELSVVKTSNQKDSEGKTIHFASVKSIDEKFSSSSSEMEGGLLEINAQEFADYDSLNNDSSHDGPNNLSHNERNIDTQNALNKLAKLIDVTDNCLYHVDNKSYKYMKDNFIMQNTEHTKEAQELSAKFKVKPIGIAGVSKTKVIEKQETVAVTPKNVKKLDRENLTPDVKFLFDAQAQVGMTVEDFAAQLGVSTPNMNAYLYRGVKPKPWVMERAKELISSDKKELVERIQGYKAIYGKKTMEEILDMWGKKLNFDVNSTKLVAEIFGVTTTTVLRWKSNLHKPVLMELNAYYDRAKFNLIEMARAEADKKSKAKEELTTA